MFGKLLQPEGGETQQTGNRNPGVTGTDPEPRDCLQKRERKSIDRAQHQLCQVRVSLLEIELIFNSLSGCLLPSSKRMKLRNCSATNLWDL